MSNNLTYLSHTLAIRKDRVIADDKRWMIRGVDRQVRKAVKSAAKAEGVGVGVWVRRVLVQALESPGGGPATASNLGDKIRLLGARLSALEKSHRSLNQKLHVPDKLATKSVSEKRAEWRRTSKSK